MSAHLMPPRPDLTRDEYVTRAIRGLTNILLREFFNAPMSYFAEEQPPLLALPGAPEAKVLEARIAALWFCRHPANRADIEEFMEVNNIDVHFDEGGITPLVGCLAQHDGFVDAVANRCGATPMTWEDANAAISRNPGPRGEVYIEAADEWGGRLEVMIVRKEIADTFVRNWLGRKLDTPPLDGRRTEDEIWSDIDDWMLSRGYRLAAG